MLAAPMPSPPSTAADAPVRILLVEDDAAISRILAEILAENGFSPRAVASGAEMDRLLERDDIDLIVLDVMLPGEDGFAICRRLRAASSVPIIMLTALGEEVDRIVGLEIGADDYVTKPFNSRELIARIRALMRRSRAAGAPAGARQGPFRFAGWQRLSRRTPALQSRRRARDDDQRGIRPAARLLPKSRPRPFARTIARFDAWRACRTDRAQRRCPCQPHPPEDRSRSARSDPDQDGTPGRLYFHAGSGGVMTRLLRSPLAADHNRANRLPRRRRRRARRRPRFGGPVLLSSTPARAGAARKSAHPSAPRASPPSSGKRRRRHRPRRSRKRSRRRGRAAAMSKRFRSRAWSPRRPARRAIR